LAALSKANRLKVRAIRKNYARRRTARDMEFTLQMFDRRKATTDALS
jgi:hypothetical protein